MSILPTWPIAAGAALVAFALGWSINGWRIDSNVQEQRAKRAETSLTAIDNRVKENVADELEFTAINQKIEGKKNEELAPVVTRINSAPRVRVGTAICPAVVTGAPKAESTGSGNGTDTGGGLVRQDVDRDIRALKLKVEEALATGRACQAFVKENGLVP